MNYLNLFVFIIAAFFIVTEEYSFPYKSHDSQKWKKKNPRKEKYINLGRKAVQIYNDENNIKTRFSRLEEVEKQHTDDSNHYRLKIITLKDCSENKVGCPLEVDADIYKKNHNSNEITYYVH